MKRLAFSFFSAALVAIGAVRAQTPSLEFGIRGGGTFTHGYTTVPPQPVMEGISTPEVNNRSNGIGLGYSAGVWVRKNFPTFFIQVEAGYNTFLLKQKTGIAQLDVNASSTIASRLPVTFAPGLVFATIDATSESSLGSINVPILLGKRWMGGKLRGYAGPNFLFVQKAEARRTSTGRINANPTVGFPEVQIPESSETTNLLSRREAGFLEVKDFTYALELGVGTTLLNRLDLDLRYAVPVGGVYKNNDITGFLGIGTVSVGYRIK